jgi:protein ImuA
MSAPALPPELAAAVWRGSDFGHAPTRVVGSGWEALDRELPGGGWPCGALTEVLSPRPALLEWRLLGAALRRGASSGGQVLLVGAPQPPFAPGLRQLGIAPEQLVWVRAHSVAERLWVAEQLLRADGAAAILVWLPQARPEPLRRLHGLAQGGQALLFALRPLEARAETSPAPLRVQARPGTDWELRVQLFKRRGPRHDAELELLAVPAALQAVLTPRLLHPGSILPTPAGADHAVGRVVPGSPARVAA